MTLSPGCLTITAAFSRRMDAYVCTIETNPATCGRSTVSQSALQTYYRHVIFPCFLKVCKKMGQMAQFPDELVKAGGLKDGFLAAGARC